MRYHHNTVRGFTLLYALLLTAIVLIVVLGTSNILYRQIVTVGVSIQGESSYLAAKAGQECALYWESYIHTMGCQDDNNDAGLKHLPDLQSHTNCTPQQTYITCAGAKVVISPGASPYTIQLVRTDIGPTKACFKVSAYYNGTTLKYTSQGLNPGNAGCTYSTTRQTARTISNI